jgi:hypothetical protein
MDEQFKCWSCGTAVVDEPMPLGREARCRVCGKDLHACRQCNFYDTSKGNRCAEPVADEVLDKERANFCGYFAVNPSAHAGNHQAQAARAQLAAMFDLDEASPSAHADADTLQRKRDDEAKAAKLALDELFGIDKEN